MKNGYINLGSVEDCNIDKQEGECVLGPNLNVDSSGSESEADDSEVYIQNLIVIVIKAS